MRISEIRPEKKHMVSVHFEGVEDALPLDKDTVGDAGLAVGDDLGEENAERLYRASQARRARERCLWYLEQRDYTEKGLSEKLYGKFGKEEIADAVAKMREAGYINDEAYARRKAARYLGEDGLSRRAAREKLVAAGVPIDVANSAVEETEYDGERAAYEVLRKKYADKLSDRDDLRRTYAAMMRRGFSGEDIKGALRLMREEEGGDE